MGWKLLNLLKHGYEIPLIYFTESVFSNFFHSYLIVLLNIYLLLQYIDCHEFITYVSG